MLFEQNLSSEMLEKTPIKVKIKKEKKEKYIFF